MKNISVFIVDDHNVVIEGISSLLQNIPGILVSGFAWSGSQCIDFLEKNSVDVILMDISMPDINGLELCKKVKETYPEIKVLALSTFDQRSYINKMMVYGASGYLLKNTTKDEILDAIKIVMNGGTYFSKELQEIISTSKAESEKLIILTKREKDILQLIVEGLTNNEMGEKLFISPDTVDSHRKNLHTKLNVKNTAMLVRYAIENKHIFS